MEFCAKEFSNFRKDVEDALSPIAKKYNLNINAGTITHNNIKFDLRVSAEKDCLDKERIEYLRNCKRYGFGVNDYQRKTIIDDKEYILVGFNERADTPCNIMLIDTRKIYICSVETTINGFKRASV